MKSILEQILDAFPHLDFLKADGLDDAVIGAITLTTFPRLIYSAEKCIQVTMEQNGWTYEEAYDFLAYNTFDAWVGPTTPVWWFDLEDEEREIDIDYGLN